MEEATSWEELHEGFREAGLRFERKGSGGIVFVGDKAIKISSIDRRFSMAKLCKRLGEFIPGDYTVPMPKIAAEPVSKIAEAQWGEYRKIRLIEAGRRQQQKAELLKQNSVEIAVFKAKQKEKREQTYANLAKYGEKFAGIAKFFLPFQQSQELMDERKKLAKMPKRACGLFKDWLRQKTPGLRTYGDYGAHFSPATSMGIFMKAISPKSGNCKGR